MKKYLLAFTARCLNCDWELDDSYNHPCKKVSQHARKEGHHILVRRIEQWTYDKVSGEVKFPNPGSDEALEQGCTCPILDNRHGAGGFDLPDGKFWINGNCPVHGNTGATIL